jgi:hypothetical protein
MEGRGGEGGASLVGVVVGSRQVWRWQVWNAFWVAPWNAGREMRYLETGAGEGEGEEFDI